jgi:serine/threonine-protein kinase
MGRVFLARRMGQAGFERLYAVKIMHDHLANEPEAVAMLVDEANIASKIHHPNVVAISDIGNEDGSYFLVMDYVEGCTLSELLRRSGARRPPRLVIPLIIDALRGLHAAHELVDADGRSLDLIHRDFSPQNLLVGVDGVCRVADFGIARASARLTHTRSTVQKGKISYMAPEQLTECTDLDRRVDIWAAGVVLWYALTGEHPFRGESEAATIHMILDRQVPPPSTVGLRPLRCFDSICLRAMERDREERYSTARAMADELQSVAVRNDLYAPQSEIADWVKLTFGAELEARRKVIRSVKDQGPAVTWIATPVLPRIAVTPSTGLRRHSRHAPPEAEPVEAPTPPSVAKRAASPSPTTRRNGARRLKTVVGIVAGSLAGFVVCLLVLVGLSPAPHRDPRADAPRSAPAGELGPRPAAADVSPGPRPQPAVAAAPAREVPRDASKARIALRGVPQGAVIRLDGIAVEGPNIEVPADGRERTVRVDLTGYAQWHQTFVATGDASFDVRLVAASRDTGRRAPTRHSKNRSSLVRDPGF